MLEGRRTKRAGNVETDWVGRRILFFIDLSSQFTASSDHRGRSQAQRRIRTGNNQTNAADINSTPSGVNNDFRL